ncbi:hypothetical protein BOTBODRAFT_202080 [Botryobasidium botryosum FD-172 SS1]|uniref:Zn(2)-C6 fungal-type domain-containing protein n=1 Tax=Botryobasidium botryosum (strain FD-172 SS1) TaxID=930990 RepID=A0A067N390_BOTB1|nr:hypothetical protein BOTBODRAFT_202080 [Botryobasidium botryosum FD-172 SS1]
MTIVDMQGANYHHLSDYPPQRDHPAHSYLASAGPSSSHPQQQMNIHSLYHPVLSAHHTHQPFPHSSQPLPYPTSDSIIPPGRKRPKYTRSKTGCLTCRRKKIKCDEAKPTCTRCAHAQRECDWPQDVPRKKSHRRRFTTSGNDDTLSTGTTASLSPATSHASAATKASPGGHSHHSHNGSPLPPYASKPSSHPSSPSLIPRHEIPYLPYPLVKRSHSPGNSEGVLSDGHSDSGARDSSPERAVALRRCPRYSTCPTPHSTTTSRSTMQTAMRSLFGHHCQLTRSRQ